MQTSTPCRAVEGWVQYYEYFHKLSADMQQTSEASAQRRSCFNVKLTLQPTDSDCFNAIAQRIKAMDKHLVRIADGDGSNAPNTVEGTRTICEADLALVRAQLRAAAQSSSLQTDCIAEAQEELLAETAQDIETAVWNQLGVGVPSEPRRSADPSTCAAAIETLLWFGLALGEPPRSLQQLDMLQRHDQQWSLSCLEADTQPDSEWQALSNLQSFPVDAEFDWQQAASEAGLDDGVKTRPPETRPLLSKGSLSQDSLESEATACPVERFDSSSSANSDGDSRAESVCSDFHDSISEACTAECGDCSEVEACSTSDARRSPSQGSDMLQAEDCGAPYSSPCDTDIDRRCSRREARPPKQWNGQGEAPLLKWEKEQQLPRTKRRAAKRHATIEHLEGCETQGPDTYETDSSEDLATQLGLDSKALEPEGCFMLFADCTTAKRQRSARRD